jgi:hypothetical protein
MSLNSPVYWNNLDFEISLEALQNYKEPNWKLGKNEPQKAIQEGGAMRSPLTVRPCRRNTSRATPQWHVANGWREIERIRRLRTAFLKYSAKNNSSYTSNSWTLHYMAWRQKEVKKYPHNLQDKPHGATRLPLDGFSLNLKCKYFSENLSRKSEFHKILKRLTGTLHEGQYALLITSRSILLRMKMFHTKVVEKIKPHISCSVTFYFRLWYNVEKYCTAGQDTDGNMAHAHWIGITTAT